MFESLKKKFNGTVGKLSDKLSEDEVPSGGSDKQSTEPEVFKDKKTPKKEKSTSKTSKKEKPTPKTSKGQKTPEITTSKQEIKDSTSEKEASESTEKEKTSRFSIFRKKSGKSESTDEKNESESDDSLELESIKESVKDSPESEPGVFGFATHKTISEGDIEDILFDLELSLLEGDVALEVAEKIIKSVETDLVGRKIKRRSDVAKYTQEALKKAISEILMVAGPDIRALAQDAKKGGNPLKIMFVGINGTGKTTTISKLANYFVSQGFTPVIAASDTFRAGAIEQITHHAENLNVKIIKHQKGADPAAVAYDAVEHARAKKKELVFIDTAGRMQTNTNLMDEMKKIQRVVKPDLVIFVGDALTGNDVVEQASKFNDAVGLDGIILTKADADAKGGAALSIGYVIQKPILFLGTGQGYTDIMEFKPEWMVEQVLGT
ncbi:MAG TPA: signal recognition particle-docking protein FtsY [Methanobacteriaceae archaeon]|nr:signal recognition particle-docking protein FtsY [Methanobacteriaceae archaeon]